MNAPAQTEQELPAQINVVDILNGVGSLAATKQEAQQTHSELASRIKDADRKIEEAAKQFAAVIKHQMPLEFLIALQKELES